MKQTYREQYIYNKYTTIGCIYVDDNLLLSAISSINSHPFNELFPNSTNNNNVEKNWS